ncbi:high mobility group box domain-containing protein, partial [Hysterangium stoloniferum]
AKKESHIPRPSNSFFLFRTDFVSKLPAGGIASGNKTLSKLAGDAWKSLPPNKKTYWEEKAHEIREEHARKYPTWRYKPRRRE